MGNWVVSIAVGFVSGVLSGAFGIGGGVLTTPAIRLLMGAPALVAVGTPLPVILPTAAAGALQYRRAGMSDVRSAAWMAAAGAPVAAAGAWLATLVGGTTVLIATAVLIFVLAADMTAQLVARPGEAERESTTVTRPRPAALAAIGVLAGLYSGFFGLGGGFVLVPMMTRWLRFPIKRALGTSLVGVALLAVPGTVTHALLGNIDWRIAAGLALGVVPGATLGAHITLGAADRAIRIGFVALLISAGVWLAVTELSGAFL